MDASVMKMSHGNRGDGSFGDIALCSAQSAPVCFAL